MLQEVHNDICARLSYGVIVHTELGDGHLCEINQTIFGNKYGVNVEPTKRETFTEVIPYLRPMDSMTLEEYDELMDIPNIALYKDGKTITNGREVDWLNKKMFDYRGLIPMGLALPAKEGMYN